MNASMVIGLCFVFATMALVNAGAQWALHSETFKRFRIRTPVVPRPPSRRKVANIAANSMVSLSCYLVVLTFGSAFLIGEAARTALAWCWEVLSALLLYDLLYYVMHRAFHRPQLMRWIHGVHHRVRHATAMEALYLHPAENVAGLGLLFASIAIVGPVGPASFLTIAFVHSFVNIVTHTNLVFPHPAFRLTNHWAIRHDHHHHGHLNANYASIFPFWDLMFGTYRR